MCVCVLDIYLSIYISLTAPLMDCRKSGDDDDDDDDDDDGGGAMK